MFAAVATDLALVDGPAALARGAVLSAIVARVVDVHQRTHHGRYRLVIETGDLDMTVLTSAVPSQLQAGDLVALARVTNRWDAHHRDIIADEQRWIGHRNDALGYLLSSEDLGIDDPAPAQPAVLINDLTPGAAFRPATPQR